MTPARLKHCASRDKEAGCGRCRRIDRKRMIQAAVGRCAFIRAGTIHRHGHRRRNPEINTVRLLPLKEIRKGLLNLISKKASLPLCRRGYVAASMRSVFDVSNSHLNSGQYDAWSNGAMPTGRHARRRARLRRKCPRACRPTAMSASKSRYGGIFAPVAA